MENEMDLILAHKRSMKLAEIAGLSLSAQTTFATAVSEVARNTIESGKSGCLILNVVADQRDNYIVACLKDEHANEISREGLEYAKRLVNKYNVSTKGSETSIELFYYITPSFRIDINKLDDWRSLFRNEPPISPYEELKRKNEQLQELSEKVQKSETQYKTLTNALPLIIFSVDKEGRMIYGNQWLFSYSGETIDNLNKNDWRTFVHEEDYNNFYRVMKEEIRNSKASKKLQVRLKSKTEGNFLWHQLSLTPLQDDSGETLYWIGYLVDIHAEKSFQETLKDNIELKKTQTKLQEYQRAQETYIEELARSNEELQQFAYVASHDLQEPVRKVLYYSDYLISQYADALPEKGSQCLKTMQQSAQRMRGLIKDLLLFSQIKKAEFQFTKVDLNKVVDQACDDFEMMIEEKKAVITKENLPLIDGDERMMIQLFENLISNALKYSLNGRPSRISITCSQNESEIRLSISDNGIGFDEKYLPQMFTLFQRLHNRSSYEGTGLGLAICKKIVDFHGGKIWATSLEGNGSTFYIILPKN